MKSFLKGLIVVCIIAAAGRAGAHHPAGGAGSAQSGPVTTVPAAGLQEGAWLVNVQTEYHSLKPFPDDELTQLAAESGHAHSLDSVLHASLGLGYGFSDDFTVMLQLPYERIVNIREAHADEPGEVHRHGDAEGIGDAAVLGHYRFSGASDEVDGAALLFGVKAPTGVTDAKDDGGGRFPTEHQPGSGSWDPLAGLAVSSQLNSLSLHANILYSFVTTGAQDTNLGDHLNYNAAVSYRLPQFESALDLVLELNGEWKDKQTIDGVRDRDSGGNTVFASPGIRFLASRSWTAYFSVSLPVLQDLNGIQNDTEYKLLGGVGVAF